jgi:formate C-acetyltransferase
MAMNDRIRRLRQQSLDAIPRISLERAQLITEFYKSGKAERVSVPVARALAFEHLMENKQICINEGELIVGERGPEPKATPTYPDICTHSLNDFEILDSRKKVSFKVTDEIMKIQEETIIPFWAGRSIRDRLFDAVDEEWRAAYDAGIFTEFMEQRAPGHTVLDDKIYSKGFIDFKNDIKKNIDSLDFYDDSDASAKREQLSAMLIAADSLMNFANRHSDKLRELAKAEADASRTEELAQMAAICELIVI